MVVIAPFDYLCLLSCFSLNPLSAVPAYASTQLLTVENVSQLVESHDVILDCTDNVYARYLLNDACVLIGKPLVSASALKFEGQVRRRSSHFL